MASKSLAISLFLFYFVQIITPLHASSNIKASSPLIQHVCSKTSNPGLCNQLLSSDPQAAKADLRGLTQISLGLTQSCANQALSTIASLFRGASPGAKTQLQTCTTSYRTANTRINTANNALKSGDLRSVYENIISAIDDSESCDDSFQVPPPISPVLRNTNKRFQDIANIVFTLVKLLA